MIKKTAKKQVKKNNKKFAWLEREIKPADLPAIYQELEKPLPQEAIKRGRTTYGMEIFGNKYQYVVNRLNRVVGMNHWHYVIIKLEDERLERIWQARCEMVLCLGNWTTFQDEITNEKTGEEPSVTTFPKTRTDFIPLIQHSHEGGCNNGCRYEARKGAITNTLKKCAAMFGVGREAYEGMEDPDLTEEKPEEKPKDEKVIEKKAEPMPMKEGTEAQQDVFKFLLTDLNSIKSREDLLSIEEKIDKNKSNLTASQMTKVIEILAELKKKHE